MEVLRYASWQKWAAGGRLVLGLLALALLWWVFFDVRDGLSLLLGLLVGLVVALYLLRTAVQPLLRSRLEVALEPRGIRIGGKFYSRSDFRGLGMASGWWAQRAQRALRDAGTYGPWAPYPPFHLDFGRARLPLFLDLPGWDRLLRHLGVDWREVPELREFLTLARGMGWLNGLMHPPEEAEQAWVQARSRYRRACAWIWIGCLGVLLGIVGVRVVEGPGGGDTPWTWALVGVSLMGLLLCLGWVGITFGLKGLARGWVSEYNPLASL